MRLSFAGDWAPETPRKEKIGDVLAVANLECAFADGDIACEKAYVSVLPRQCMDNIPTGGFAALSVANNHVNDAGNFHETYAELTRRFPNIQFFGTQDKPHAEFEENGQKIFVIGCLEPCRSRGDFIFKQEDVVDLIRSLRVSPPSPSTSTFIYVYPHWGMEGEYTRYPSPKQLRLAREWIDVGADGVFGSHSHVPQGRETYKGKSIYYSLGNFDFDHPEGMLYEGTRDELTVTVKDGRCEEIFDSDVTRAAVEKASEDLVGWSIWKWAKTVGPINLRKNMASWRLRLKKNFLRTILKFVVWQLLPKTVLFRVANLWPCYKK